MCIFTVSLLNVAFLYQYSYIIDAIAGKDMQAFILYLVSMSVTVLAMLVFEYVRQIVNVIYLNQIGFDLQATFIGKILNLSYGQFAEQGAGAYISQINNDLERVKDEYYDAFFTIFQGSCTFVIASFALLSLDGWTAIFIILISFLPVLIPYLFKEKRRQNQLAISEAQQDYNTRVTDIFFSYLQVKNSDRRSAIVEELDSRYQQANRQISLANQTTVTMRLLVGLVFYVTTLLIILIGGYQVFAGSLTVGGLTAILTISEQLVDPINSVANAFLDRHAVKDLRKEFQAELTSISDSQGLSSVSQPVQTLEICNGRLTLGDKLVFDGLNIRFERGKKYVVVGESGAGKSSLALLLTKNSQLQDGDILFNQTPIHELSYQEVQEKLAYLPQEGYLFHDTVLYNLTLGREVAEEKVMQLLAVMGLTSRFPTYPSLMELVSDESGLSGGQKQRLNLIRVLLEEKEVLLLDESLSALDAETYRRVEEYLTSLPNVMLIHISHRLSDDTVNLYDELIRL
ncbi:ATP-binding cassette domain-containing protein [Streptococcus suis]